MSLLLLAFLSGLLTVVAPCIIPILPVVLGINLGRKLQRTVIVILALCISIALFTLLVRTSVVFIGVPLNLISGFILSVVGLFTVFPATWEKLTSRLSLTQAPSKMLLSDKLSRLNISRDILVGISLGPIFTSCSPTYFYILATVLPVGTGSALLYLTSYLAGLAAVMMLVAIFGNKIFYKFDWIVNRHSTFYRLLGLMIFLIGIAVVLGVDKQIETWVLNNTTLITELIRFENNALQSLTM